MRTQPELTVALPVYNGEDYLAQAIESVLGQSFSNFELLISEGGSTDNTKDIIHKYKSQDRRIRYESTDSRIPQIENCNRLLALSTTAWVHFFCHDDILFPNALEQVSAAICSAKDSVGLIGSPTGLLLPRNTAFFQTSQETVVREWSPGEPSVTSSDAAITEIYQGIVAVKTILRGGGSPPLPALTNACVRRASLQKIGGFDPRFPKFDTAAWLRMLITCDYLFIRTPLTLTRIHGKQVTADLSRLNRNIPDAELFWTEFVDEASKASIPLTWVAKTLPTLKASSVAATLLYIAKVRGELGTFASLFIHFPFLIKLLSIPLYFRSSHLERKRLRPVSHLVSPKELYP